MPGAAALAAAGALRGIGSAKATSATSGLFSRRLKHLTPLLGRLATNSRDFKLHRPTEVPPPAILGPFLNFFVEGR